MAPFTVLARLQLVKLAAIIDAHMLLNLVHFPAAKQFLDHLHGGGVVVALG
jgi:hypothetical protein